MKIKKIKNWFKKIFYLQIGLFFFISCANETKKKNSFLLLTALVNEFSISSSENNSKTKLPKELNIQDPLYNDQWYLKNTGQFGGKAGIDINVEPVWKQGYTGDGVKIGVLDDPLQSNHPDLLVNASNITDYYSDSICHPTDNKKHRGHGMQVAGIIAARANDIGLRGIAFRSTLYSYGVIDNTDDPSNQTLSRYVTQALNSPEHQQIAVYNGSIGTGGKYEKITNDLYQAVEQVTKQGFGGKGSSLVFAAGNSGLGMMNNSLSEAWLSHHYSVIVVNSVNSQGESVTNFGGQGGVNLWLGAPSRQVGEKNNMPTTHVICGASPKLYEMKMNATSGATPMVTGVVALLRQAYPNLTWRDVKLILAESAKKITAGSQQYQKTGQMYSDFSKEQQHDRYTGFGLVDAAAAFQLAKTWKSLPPLKKTQGTQTTALNTPNRSTWYETTLTLNNGESLAFIESVTLQMQTFAKRTAGYAGNDACISQWNLELVSPDQTKSIFFRANGKSEFSYSLEDSFTVREGRDDIRLISNSFLGSSSITGSWKLKIRQNTPSKFNCKSQITQIANWKLTVRGH